MFTPDQLPRAAALSGMFRALNKASSDAASRAQQPRPQQTPKPQPAALVPHKK